MIIPSYAVLSAGNFWDLQEKLEKYTGIVSTMIGYTGGHLPNPNYQQVAHGDSGHLEAVKVAYNETLLSYDHLLDIFFEIHNPQEPVSMSCQNGQLFNPAIFYLNEEQQKIALSKQEYLQQKLKHPILTEIRPLENFYPAEPYHQHFTLKPGQTSCCLTNEC